MVQGHVPNTTTHFGTNVNPANSERAIFPSQVGIVGRLQAKVMADGDNAGSGGNQAARIPTWNQQANMGMGMGMEGVLTMVTL